MKTPAATEAILRSPAGLRNDAHECEHSEHSEHSRLNAGRGARAEGPHGHCDHWDHSRRLARLGIARFVENAWAEDESKGTINFINFINFRAFSTAKARPGSNLGNHQLHQLCVNFGSPRGAQSSIRGDLASRRIFRVVAESARVPNQPRGRAEGRSAHQRERHPDHVERLITTAGGT
jgi:hypothetical protein